MPSLKAVLCVLRSVLENLRDHFLLCGTGAELIPCCSSFLFEILPFFPHSFSVSVAASVHQHKRCLVDITIPFDISLPMTRQKSLAGQSELLAAKVEKGFSSTVPPPFRCFSLPFLSLDHYHPPVWLGLGEFLCLVDLLPVTVL